MDLNGKKIIMAIRDPGASQAVLLLYRPLKKLGANVCVAARGPGFPLAVEAGTGPDVRRQAQSGYPYICDFVRAERPDLIVTGTSINDDLERDYIKAGKACGVPVVSFIDWWTNFEKRFIYSKTGETCVPDWICVVDGIAEGLCRKYFGNRARIVRTGNPYFSSATAPLRGLGNIRKRMLRQLSLDPGTKTILYLAEPTEPPVEYNQFKIFERVAGELSKVSAGYGKSLNLIVKFHPNGEKEDIYRRYGRIAKEKLAGNINVRMVKKKYNASELIASSDYVWGMNTTPLFEAMMRGRLVSSFLPGVDIPGIPFLKMAGYCPSANAYSQFPGLVRSLLTDEKFVRKARLAQKRYEMPRENFFKTFCGIAKAELTRKGRR
ncbi:MAG: hypothetical protein PHX64_02385 [Candidatus Omnitrophica bacterium]|nr:hypothetical protein [Candidatus Omnitrophota bacterium]MDD5310583.1 hypothetical protein [Candidatus Omnitrophota bacterium]MDD5545991.1 hypothetical protein [Candidatus Omnitrophota bacterium]